MHEPLLRRQEPLDEVFIEGLSVNCILGALLEERQTKQEIRCDVRFSLNAAEVAQTADLKMGVDYRIAAEHIRYILEHGRFFLLETAAEMLTADLLDLSPSISSVRLRLYKPAVFQSSTVPSLQIVRTQASLKQTQISVKKEAVSSLSCLFEHRHGGRYQIELPPHHCLALSLAGEARTVLVLQGHLQFQGSTLDAGQYATLGEGQEWKIGSGDDETQLLCLTKPSFSIQKKEGSAHLKEEENPISILDKKTVGTALQNIEYACFSAPHLNSF